MDRCASAITTLMAAPLACPPPQIQHGVEAPILVDLRLAGLVEAWASGCTWEELMTDCRWVLLGGSWLLLGGSCAVFPRPGPAAAPGRRLATHSSWVLRAAECCERATRLLGGADA